jgi:hypothetical protein
MGQVAQENRRRKWMHPAYKVACPECGAKAGKACVGNTNYYPAHRARALLAFGGELRNVGIGPTRSKWAG